MKESSATAIEQTRSKAWTRSTALTLTGIFIISSAVLLVSVRRTVFYHDESGWMASGYHYSALLLQHPFDWNEWNNSRYGPWGSMNPQLGKWFIGFPLALYYRLSGRAPFDGIYDENRSYGENLRNGNIPPPELLNFSRTVSAVFGIACIVLVFIIGDMSFNSMVGALAALLVLANKPFRLAASRAMTDVHFNLFLLLFLLSLILVQRRNGSSLWRWLGGMFAGCACSIKITGLPICASILLVFLIYKRVLDGGRARDLVRPLASFSVAALMTVYMLNPFFWPSLAGFDLKAALHELKAASAEKIHLSEKARIPEQYQQQYPQLWNLSHPIEFPLLYVRWNRFMAMLSAGQGGAPLKFSELWQGSRMVHLNRALFMDYASLSSVGSTVIGEKPYLKYPAGAIELALLGLGIASCLRRASVFQSLRNPNDCGVPLVNFAANYLFILFLLTVNFDRYYLPAIIGSKLLVAAGAWISLVWIWAGGRAVPKAKDIERAQNEGPRI